MRGSMWEGEGEGEGEGGFDEVDEEEEGEPDLDDDDDPAADELELDDADTKLELKLAPTIAPSPRYCITVYTFLINGTPNIISPTTELGVASAWSYGWIKPIQ